MAEVTLNQILNSREERAEKQKNTLNRFHSPLISFTMNIAGPVKTSPLIERAFFEGIRLLDEALENYSVLYRDINIKVTGCEAIFCVKTNAKKLKDISVQIEESISIGRLFDIDVIDTNGNKLERNNIRGCLVCDAPGRSCAVSRAHSVEELQNTTKIIIENYFFTVDKYLCSSLAVKSLLDEAYTTPKPGLVDCRNNGSHCDMDIHLFKKSAISLKSYFEECFYIGRKTADLPCDKAFYTLQKAGINAEKTMYNVTGGVNTHKGAIYSLGILCASAGRLWTPEKNFAEIAQICSESASFVKDTFKKELEQVSSKTHGGRVYKSYGLTGIRGEVASGFCSVLNIGIPCYKKLKDKGFTENYAGCITLLNLISNVKDTNLYHRGGTEGAQYAIQRVVNLLNSTPEPEIEQIELLDEDFICRNLSPGGCADLLAITYFLSSLEEHTSLS